MADVKSKRPAFGLARPLSSKSSQANALRPIISASWATTARAAHYAFRMTDCILIRCGSAASGLSDADARQVRAALDAKHAVIVTVEDRGFAPAESCAIRSSGHGIAAKSLG